MINLWKEGFKTESYTILGLTPLNEMELMIMYEYCESFMVQYTKETEENGVKKVTNYQKIDKDKIKDLIKSKDAEFSEKLNDITELLCNILGEEVVKPLPVFELFFTVLELYLEISLFKKDLKKK